MDLSAWREDLSFTTEFQQITRNSVLDSLVPYFKDEKYILLVCDMGFGKIDQIKELYPERVINCGIMEQATVGIASGMAEAGLKPIIYSIASFIVYRALEQIRNDIVLRGVNVKIIGSGSGDYFKDMGACHWCKDDDIKLLNIIGLPVYEDFGEWINSNKAGYFRC